MAITEKNRFSALRWNTTVHRRASIPKAADLTQLTPAASTYACSMSARLHRRDPIVTAVPSPPPSSSVSPASQTWLYWFFSGSSA